jgi:hypothetical protein
MNKPSDTLERLRARSIEAGRFVLPLDPVWAEKVLTASNALRNLETYGDPDDPERSRRVAEAKAELGELTANVEGEVMVFKFRRLSRAAYDAIVSRNPATKEQIEQAKEDEGPRARLVWNPKTFPVDLLATVLIEPKFDGDELVEMLNGDEDPDAEPLLSKGEAEAILAAAMQTALSVPPTLPAALSLP